jgi:hypothetical protein
MGLTLYCALLPFCSQPLPAMAHLPEINDINRAFCLLLGGCRLGEFFER